MPIIPSGRRRVMEAQSTLNMDNQWGVPGMKGSPDEYPVQEQVEPTPQTDMQIGAENQDEQISGRKNDLREYIMEKLQGFGYPPRRLEQFSDEFVEEEIFPGGMRDITITIPDRYYGTRRSLSDKDLSQIIEEIQSEFGMEMTSAKRADKKAIIKLRKEPKGKRNGEEEEEVQRDDLDEIFGTPESTKPQKSKKAAQTITELVTANSENLFERLLSTLSSAKKDEIKSQSEKRSVILDALFQEK